MPTPPYLQSRPHSDKSPVAAAGATINLFDWESAPEPWRSIGLDWRARCQSLRKALPIVPASTNNPDGSPRVPDLAPVSWATEPRRADPAPKPAPIPNKPVPTPKKPAPAAAAVIARPVRADPTRLCADCLWSGPSSEYAAHRRDDHG